MMNKENSLKLKLPLLLPFEAKDCRKSLTYIGAAGFEPRAFSVINSLTKDNVRVDNAIAITYLPFDNRNKVKKFGKRLKGLTSSISWVIYNRHDPQSFQNSFPSLFATINSKSVLIDISAMSKMLIMLVLQLIRKTNKEVIITYSEASTYYPTIKEFQTKKRLKVPTDFLTSDVFRILHVTSLSSSSMQGHPILLIAYPTFNHKEIVALHNELSPNCMLLILGMPHEKHNEWRLKAIKEINSRILDDSDYCREIMTLSTFDYISNTLKLEEIYQKYKYTHRILLAPTGSKLQTIACFMFKQLHPDVQIVYPATEYFSGDYTDGCKAIWCIPIANFLELISQLDKYRWLS